MKLHDYVLLLVSMRRCVIDTDDKAVCVYDTCSQCVCVCVCVRGPERGRERDGGLNDGAQCERMDTSITVHAHTHTLREGCRFTHLSVSHENSQAYTTAQLIYDG